MPHRLPRRAALPRRRARQCDTFLSWVSLHDLPFFHTVVPTCSGVQEARQAMHKDTSCDIAGSKANDRTTASRQGCGQPPAARTRDVPFPWCAEQIIAATAS